MVLKGLVVDTNIVFSALQKSGKIREIIFLMETNFFTPNFLIVEILKFRNKIFSLTSITDDDFSIIHKILNKIDFINEKYISYENRIKAYEICKDVDEKDTPFIALCMELDLPLWSNDHKLANGLKVKGFYNILTTKEISALL